MRKILAGVALLTIAPAVAGRMAQIFLESMEGTPPPSVFVALVLLALAAFWPNRKDAA